MLFKVPECRPYGSIVFHASGFHQNTIAHKTVMSPVPELEDFFVKTE
jgi:hypothetical protein